MKDSHGAMNYYLNSFHVVLRTIFNDIQYSCFMAIVTTTLAVQWIKCRQYDIKYCQHATTEFYTLATGIIDYKDTRSNIMVPKPFRIIRKILEKTPSLKKKTKNIMD